MPFIAQIGILIASLALAPFLYFVFEKFSQKMLSSKAAKRAVTAETRSDRVQQAKGFINFQDFTKIEKKYLVKNRKYLNYSLKLKKVCPELVSPVTLFILSGGFFLGGAYVGFSMTGNPLIGGVLGSMGAMGILIFLTNHFYGKYFTIFLDEFVYALDMIVRGVRSGLVLGDCFGIIAEETHPIIAKQFEMLRDDLRIGIPFETSMKRLCERVPLKEVRFFAISLTVQQKTGGNLSEIVANLANMLRQRKKIILRIKALSSEAKASALILGSLPIGVAGVLQFVAAGYLEPLFTSTTGHIILGGCALWMSIGVFIMRKMINFYK